MKLKNIFDVNSCYAELQLSKTREDERYINERADKTNTSWHNSIKGIEQRLDKILNVSNKVDELETKYISLKKWFKEIESGQDLICSKFGKQEKKVAKITRENKELQKENNLLNKMIKWLDGNLEIKKKNKKESTGTIWQVGNDIGYWYTRRRWWKLYWNYL